MALGAPTDLTTAAMLGPSRGAGPCLVEGRNCWRIVDADRIAFLIDAAAYFRRFKSAALAAERSIFIVGWEMSSRTELEFPQSAQAGVPNELGPFLDDLALRRPDLQIRVLDWASPRLYAPDREWLRQVRFDWMTQPNLRYTLDDHHPVGASHHQKIVVIDDRMAFVGGLDLTTGRLDDSTHRADDMRRRKPDGTAYEPFHDVQVAVYGDAARQLGDLVRRRWRRATGERLAPVEGSHDIWPADLPADITAHPIAIARTMPPWRDEPGCNEIETLYYDSLSAARDWIYIETQYLVATGVVRRLCDRLRSDDCPEIIVVTPQQPTGWIEQTTMGTKQRLAVAQLRAADRNNRLRIYIPVVGDDGAVAVKVHSKLMVVDGRFVQIGSANLNNRSFGLDTECNVAIAAEDESAAAAIAALRNRLLAEHLGMPAERLAREIDRRASMIDAVESHRGPHRGLRPFPDADLDRLLMMMAETELLDPHAPMEPDRVAADFTDSEGARRTLRARYAGLVAFIVMLFGLAAMWQWGPLSQFVDRYAIEAWISSIGHNWLATAAFLSGYVVLSLLMFPITVLIAATGLLFGPVWGFGLALAGSLMSAVCAYAVGAKTGSRTLRRIAGGRLGAISRRLAERGILAVTVVRILPIAPFTIVNLAAGASHIRLRDFATGTVLGMTPGIMAITAFSSQVWQTVRSPSLLNLAIAVGIFIVIVAATIWSWRHFAR